AARWSSLCLWLRSAAVAARACAPGPRAVPRHAVLAGSAAVRGARGREDVHARVAGPAAVIGAVARAALRGARAACRGRGEAVGRAGARGARAALGHVALARRGAADGARGREDVHAGVAGPAAVI